MAKKVVKFDGKFSADDGKGKEITGEGKGEIIYEPTPTPARHAGCDNTDYRLKCRQLVPGLF
jgi:hypothetical protein